MADAQDEAYGTGEEADTLEFPVAMVVDASARFATMGTTGGTAGGMTVQDKAGGRLFHSRQPDAGRTAFLGDDRF